MHNTQTAVECRHLATEDSGILPQSFMIIICITYCTIQITYIIIKLWLKSTSFWDVAFFLKFDLTRVCDSLSIKSTYNFCYISSKILQHQKPMIKGLEGCSQILFYHRFMHGPLVMLNVNMYSPFLRFLISLLVHRIFSTIESSSWRNHPLLEFFF